MERYIYALLLLFASVSLQAQYPLLSKDAEISLLTVSPSEDEVYTVYGHTALRVRDTSKNSIPYLITGYSTSQSPTSSTGLQKEKPITDSQRNIHATSWSNMRCGGAKSPNKSWISIPQEKHGYGKPWWLITGRKTACIAIISFLTIVRQDPPPLSKIRQMENRLWCTIQAADVPRSHQLLYT